MFKYNTDFVYKYYDGLPPEEEVRENALLMLIITQVTEMFQSMTLNLYALFTRLHGNQYFCGRETTMNIYLLAK